MSRFHFFLQFQLIIISYQLAEIGHHLIEFHIENVFQALRLNQLHMLTQTITQWDALLHELTILATIQFDFDSN